MKERLKETAIIIIFMSFLINMPFSVWIFYKYLALPKSSPEYEHLEEALDAFFILFSAANNILVSITIILAITAGHILGQFIIKEKIEFKGGKFPIFPFNIIALICFLGLVLITLLSVTVQEFMATVMLSVYIYIETIVNTIENWDSLSWLMKSPVIYIISFLFYCISVFSFYAVPAIVIFTLAYLVAGYFHSRRSLKQ